MDVTWLYHYDPETKQQSLEWRQAAHPTPKTSECKNPLERLSLRFFWDPNGILLIDYLPKDQTNKAEYYSSLQVQVNDILKENATRSLPRGFCTCTTMPQLNGH
jgi:hypothetical protein